MQTKFGIQAEKISVYFLIGDANKRKYCLSDSHAGSSF